MYIRTSVLHLKEWVFTLFQKSLLWSLSAFFRSKFYMVAVMQWSEKENISACLVDLTLLQKHITSKISAVLFEHWT